MEKVFGFSYKAPQYGHSRQYIYLQVEDLENLIDVRGYDYIYSSMGFMGTPEDVHGSVYVKYNEGSKIINIVNEGRVIYSKNLESLAKDLVEKHAPSLSENTLPKSHMVIIEDNEEVEIKIMFLGIGGSISDSNEDIEINNMEFNAIFKLKNSH